MGGFLTWAAKPKVGESPKPRKFLCYIRRPEAILRPASFYSTNCLRGKFRSVSEYCVLLVGRGFVTSVSKTHSREQNFHTELFLNGALQCLLVLLRLSVCEDLWRNNEVLIRQPGFSRRRRVDG